MRLVDTHCHLDIPPLSAQPQAVLERARQAGVCAVVALAYDLKSFDAVEKLAQLAGVAPVLGLHPWVAHEPLDVADLEKRLRRCRAVAVGEIGLDFKLEGCDQGRQLEVLEQQLEVACRLELPVMLHCRGAFDELLAVLCNASKPVRGVLHAFSRSPEIMGQFIDAGLHIAFGGAVTRETATRARRAAAACPAERLLLETDAPSIGLQGVPAEEVEPRHVREIALCIAGLRGISLEEVAEVTTSNATALLGPRLGAARP
ncbi:MAG: TatD family hydrolase [Myxococcota bacterium]|jgi:TatD DNase family protein|nr:TatD family hydrolase [Myxococcota bacterium]